MGFEETRAYKIWEYLQTQEVPRAIGYIADALEFDYFTTVAGLEALFSCQKVRKVEVVAADGNCGESVLTRRFFASEKTAFRLRDRWEDVES